MKKDISIVGAGLVGSLLAAYFGKKGHRVNVYERRSDIRKATISVGKSINMACSTRGWKALDLVGVGDIVRKSAIPMSGRVMHSISGELTYQPYGKSNEAIYSISRAGLNQILISFSDEMDNVSYHFNHKCIDVDLHKPEATFIDSKKNQISTLPEMIFGTDGAFSAVRLAMQKQKHFDYSQEYISHDYKELVLPAKEGEFQLEKNALHIWPRGSYMLIGLPNLDGSFTCTLFLPYQGKNSFEQLTDSLSIEKFFEEKFADAKTMIPDLVEQFQNNPTSSLVQVKCFPWTFEDKIALLGDASHGIVPFYGQGMNSGFEDISILDEIIEESNDWNEILSKFQESRKPNTDVIADLAIQNFIEMRDLVGQESFLVKKKIERALNELYPEKFIPQYSMVSFSNIPYSEAKKRGDDQEAILHQLSLEKDILSIIDAGKLKSLINQSPTIHI